MVVKSRTRGLLRQRMRNFASSRRRDEGYDDARDTALAPGTEKGVYGREPGPNELKRLPLPALWSKPADCIATHAGLSSLLAQ